MVGALSLTAILLRQSPVPLLFLLIMQFQLQAAFFSTLAFTTLAEQYGSSPLRSRNNPPAFSVTPGINATITSSSGQDVTSNFPLLLYDPTKAATSNLTDRQVLTARPLNFCRFPRQRFQHSHCDYLLKKGGVEAIQPGEGEPLRRYVIYCRTYFRDGTLRRFYDVPQRGACFDDEICVDGASTIDRSNRDTTAKCVPQSLFKPIEQPHTEEQALDVIAKLRGIMAVAALTQTDGQTPQNMSKLELDSGVGEEGKEEMQTVETCTDCFTLATSKLPEGMNFLKMQATLSSVGAAAAGFMYLAVLG